MIKQSFLRNYNISKIYSQVEDQKRKLQVFYARQVEKIAKQKRQMDRKIAKQMTCKQHRQERLKLKQTIRMMKENRYSEDKQSFRTTKVCRKYTEKDESSLVLQKKKTDLYVSNLSLKSYLNSENSQHQSLKISTVPNRSFHKKMLQSIMLRLKEGNCLQANYDSRKQNPVNKLGKRKNNTNTSVYFNSEIFDFQRQLQAQIKTIPTRHSNKIRFKRMQNSKLLIKRHQTYNQISTIIKNPKPNIKCRNYFQAKEGIKQKLAVSQI